MNISFTRTQHTEQLILHSVLLGWAGIRPHRGVPRILLVATTSYLYLWPAPRQLLTPCKKHPLHHCLWHATHHWPGACRLGMCPVGAAMGRYSLRGTVKQRESKKYCSVESSGHKHSIMFGISSKWWIFIYAFVTSVLHKTNCVHATQADMRLHSTWWSRVCLRTRL